MLSAIKQELKQVSEAMKNTKSCRMLQRYQAIKLYLEKYSVLEIAKIIGRTSETVNTYISTYLKSGLEGLIMKKPPGRPFFITAQQKEELKFIVANKSPEDVGFPAEMNWTAPLVKEVIWRQFQIAYSNRGALRLLNELGFSCTRPTYTLANADPNKQEAFKKKIENLKLRLLNGDIDCILFEDEAMIRDYQAIGRTWFLKGQQRIIPTFGKHQGVKLIGTLDYETGEIFCIEEEHYDAEAFLRFLQLVLKNHQGQRIVIILDNAKIHHAKLLRPFLREHRYELELVFLPPYSPHLNLIEEFWGWLKRSCVYNVFYSSVAEIRKRVRIFVDEINKKSTQVIDRLCIPL